MPKLLLIIALISILTTVGIVVTLLSETIEFFKLVPFVEFFRGTVLKPLGNNAQFGILPLVTGTLLTHSNCHACSDSDRINVCYLFK